MKPLRIGISANFFYPDKDRNGYAPKTLIYGEESLYQWIESSGAIPYMVPRMSGTLTLRDVVNDLDGIVFSGGADICPKSYGEQTLKPKWEGDYERDQYEIELFHTAFEAGKPILGVCRGHQLINVALGGTMYQDIQTQNESAQCHRDGDIYDKLDHDITISPGSVLSDIYEGLTEGRINSIHHQAVKELGKGLVAQAHSIPDKIIESIWLEDSSHYVLGIQWHPEWVKKPEILPSRPILNHFFDCIL